MTPCENQIKFGGCCCICKNQFTLHKHPWNKDNYAKGPVTEVMGWVCKTDELGACFFDHLHGFCELFKRKDMKNGTIIESN